MKYRKKYFPRTKSSGTRRRKDAFETVWSADLCAELRTKHGFMIHSMKADESQAGWPDKLLVGPKGFLMFAEFKNERTRLEDRQRLILQRLNLLTGGKCVIVRKEKQGSDGAILFDANLKPIVRFSKRAEFFEALMAFKSMKEKTDSE